MKILFANLTFAMILAAGCGDDAHEESIDVEGCEHLQEGPAAPITAAADAAGAPAVDDDHRRYDVSLPDVGGGQRGGFVAFAAAEATDYVFFLSADVAVAFTDAGGQPVAIEESTSSSPECEEIRGRHLIELAVGTVAIELGPTAEAEVSIVVEPAGEHDHEHE
jgi:hypothetical protein